jgi:7-carboxy-7-deazaguanine synthase
MRVNEIFFSIQGESSHQGTPCVFVRLSGCNLRCRYCDTQYAYDDGEEVPLEEVLGKVTQYPSRIVEITGGEPLLQEESLELARRLLDRGYAVLIETNGTVDVSAVDPRAVRIVDIKCPGSGHSHAILWENLRLLGERDEVKFVITSRDDYEWAKEVVRREGLAEKHAVLFSPAFGSLVPAELASWILQDGLPVRLNLQIHKYIWKPGERGR